MYRIALTPSEEQDLEQTFKTTPDRRLRDRCQAVLMVARGRAGFVATFHLRGVPLCCSTDREVEERRHDRLQG
jgi:hypothetical protein